MIKETRDLETTGGNIRIQAFTIDRYEAALALWRSCGGIGLSTADSKDNIQRYLARNPGMSFVAEVRHAVIGAVLCGHDGRRGYLHHLAVRPDYRRHGIGRRLVAACLAALQSAGIQKCHLFIIKGNTGGLKFWEKINWTLRTDLDIVSKDIAPRTEIG